MHYARVVFALNSTRCRQQRCAATRAVQKPGSYGERRAAWLSDEMQRTSLDDMLVTTIDEVRYYEILGVSAAVFDAAGCPVGTVGIADPAKPVIGADLQAIGATRGSGRREGHRAHRREACVEGK